MIGEDVVRGTMSGAQWRQDLVLHAAEYEQCATSNHKEAEGGVDQPINARNVRHLSGDPCADDLPESEED